MNGMGRTTKTAVEVDIGPSSRPPPDMGSGGRHRDERGINPDKAAWVGLVSALMMMGREISGAETSVSDVTRISERAVQLYDDITDRCGARPTRVF
jgi:hypothetical protein